MQFALRGLSLPEILQFWPLDRIGVEGVSFLQKAVLLAPHVSIAGIAPTLLQFVHVLDLEKVEFDPVLPGMLRLRRVNPLLMNRLLDAPAHIVDLLLIFLDCPQLDGDLFLHVTILGQRLHDVSMCLLILLEDQLGEGVFLLLVERPEHRVSHFALILRLGVIFFEFDVLHFDVPFLKLLA